MNLTLAPAAHCPVTTLEEMMRFFHPFLLISAAHPIRKPVTTNHLLHRTMDSRTVGDGDSLFTTFQSIRRPPFAHDPDTPIIRLISQLYTRT